MTKAINLWDSDEGKAVDALINWMRSQDITPARGLPILAKAMVVAVASLNKAEGNKDDYDKLEADVQAAADLIPEVLVQWRKSR
jgi:hypothetical protein